MILLPLRPPTTFGRPAEWHEVPAGAHLARRPDIRDGASGWAWTTATRPACVWFVQYLKRRDQIIQRNPPPRPMAAMAPIWTYARSGVLRSRFEKRALGGVSICSRKLQQALPLRRCIASECSSDCVQARSAPFHCGRRIDFLVSSAMSRAMAAFLSLCSWAPVDVRQLQSRSEKSVLRSTPTAVLDRRIPGRSYLRGPRH